MKGMSLFKRLFFAFLGVGGALTALTRQAGGALARQLGTAGDAIVAFLPAVILAFLASFYLSRRISRPIIEVASGLEATGKGDLSGRVEAKATGEVAVLVDSFNRMTEALRRSQEDHAGRYDETRRRTLQIEQDIAGRVETEQALRKAYAEMERRVEEHTTELVAANDRLEQARDAAVAANSAKSNFLANMSHELRTPLQCILSFSNFGLRNGATAEREKLLDYFEKIHGSGNVLLTLLNELLDLAKLESGKMSFDFQPVDLGNLVGGVTDEFISLISERGLSIRYVPPAAGTGASVDAEKIKQVTRNLLSNAAKFSSPGSTIEVGVRQQEGSAVVSVCDQGSGIPEDELEAIFDKFIQSSANRPGGGGTGLGLSICREIIAAHRGRIWAENRSEGGAVISFEIPLGVRHEPEPTLRAAGAGAG